MISRLLGRQLHDEDRFYRFPTAGPKLPQSTLFLLPGATAERNVDVCT
jgi:hypothetical protein